MRTLLLGLVVWYVIGLLEIPQILAGRRFNKKGSNYGFTRMDSSNFPTRR